MNNEALGVVSLTEALKLADDAEVDLVEIAPQADPAVCRLMDFGKFRYQKQKKAHDARLKQKTIQLKEVKFRPGTEENDYQVKVRNIIRFLSEGDKAKVTMRFKGREIAHQPKVSFLSIHEEFFLKLTFKLPKKSQVIIEKQP